MPVTDPFGQEAGTLELQLKARLHPDGVDCVPASTLATAELAGTERWFRGLIAAVGYWPRDAPKHFTGQRHMHRIAPCGEIGVSR